MQTGNNIQNFRKRMQKTQEELAELVGVSRQTISKWESGACYPEMEKLVLMCELFDCDLDTLVREDAVTSIEADNIGYDTHTNHFIRQICGGTVSVLLGVSIMLALIGFGVAEEIATMVFLGFVVIGAAIFILGGIQHGDFVKKHPQIPNFYTEAQKEKFQHKFPILLVTGIVLVMLGVMLLIGVSVVVGEKRMEQDEALSCLITAIFMLFITVAAPVFIYAGMQKYKYNTEEYNLENRPEKSKCQKLKETLNSCIMLSATAVFLVWELAFEGWSICWIVYVVGGLLCGVTSTICGALERQERKNHEPKE